ncbi:hypothetical protein [Streptomyces sp. NPDC017529]|uniref:hypothetical protein n=1 Tax=Streptomyces sp. NPDC017529 TaxID=3365000 RepID=UPI003795446A
MTSPDGRHRYGQRHARNAYLNVLLDGFIYGACLGALLHFTAQYTGKPPRNSLWTDIVLVGVAFLVFVAVHAGIRAGIDKVRGRTQLPTTARAVQHQLLAELHRRTQHMYDHASDIPASHADCGEVRALRTAVGVAHGYAPGTPQCEEAAERLHEAWCARRNKRHMKAVRDR